MGCCHSEINEERPPSLFDVDGKSNEEATRCRAIQTAGSSLPPELIRIIIEFAAPIQHTWSSEPVFWSEKESAITVEGTTVRCADSSSWYKIVSAKSVIDGPRKWKIVTEFGDNASMGLIAIGVTLSGSRHVKLERTGWEIGSTKDVLASVAKDQRQGNYDYCGGQVLVYDRWTWHGTSRYGLFGPKCQRRKSVALIQLSLSTTLGR